MSALPANLRLRDPAVLLATWFGVGLLPRAPGTWGSLAALPVAGLLYMGWGALGVAFAGAVLFAAGWWASAAVVRRGGGADPSFVVIDEVAGQLLVLSVVPLDPLYYAAAFAAFRVFDIFKPWPVGWADREIKGGFGIMFDDILAALYAAIILVGARYFLAA